MQFTRKRQLQLVLLSLLASGLTATKARAGIFEQMGGCVARVMEELVVEPGIENLQHAKIAIGLTGGSRVEVILGERLGRGYFGTVYRLPPEEAIKLGLPRDHYVVKTPNVLRGTRISLTKASITGEAANLVHLTSRTSAIEKSAHYPKDPAWRKGSLPVIPVVARMESELGPVLIKPEAYGILSIRDLAIRYWTSLPAEMKKALRDIYELTQAIADKVEAVPGGGGRYSLDIRPPNLFWVEDPVVLRRMGMNRPGFAMFEMDKLPAGDFYTSGGMTFAEYLRQFTEYMSASLAKQN